jgi:hypothetical protein
LLRLRALCLPTTRYISCFYSFSVFHSCLSSIIVSRCRFRLP